MASVSKVRRLVFLGVGAAAILGGAATSLFSQGLDQKHWVSYGGDAASTRFFDSQQIDRSNVANLEIAWTYPHAEATFHPLMAGGVVYGRVGGNAIVALDAKTGEALWVHDGLNGMTRPRHELLGE